MRVNGGPNGVAASSKLFVISGHGIFFSTVHRGVADSPVFSTRYRRFWDHARVAKGGVVRASILGCRCRDGHFNFKPDCSPGEPRWAKACARILDPL